PGTSAEPPISPSSDSAETSAEQSVSPTPDAAEETTGITGKSFVITGNLKNLTYEQVTQRITDAGGRINKMPSGKTDYIVVGKNPGSKLKKAEKYNTPQLNESQLLALLDEKGNG
ncbi:MAG: BRCT domain-containing protein, partial [Cyanobacteria bacterium J06642_11]